MLNQTLAQITIPSDVISQLFAIFLLASGSIALLINYGVKRFGIGNQSMQASVSAQEIINQDYQKKSGDNQRMLKENILLRYHLVGTIKMKNKADARVAHLEKEVSDLRSQLATLEKTETKNSDLIEGYKRLIADKEDEIERLQEELEKCA